MVGLRASVTVLVAPVKVVAGVTVVLPERVATDMVEGLKEEL